MNVHAQGVFDSANGVVSETLLVGPPDLVRFSNERKRSKNSSYCPWGAFGTTLDAASLYGVEWTFTRSEHVSKDKDIVPHHESSKNLVSFSGAPRTSLLRVASLWTVNHLFVVNGWRTTRTRSSP